MPFLNEIMKGTLILTIAGLLSRFLGFYNRIYLSNLIGARELGIFQLIFPIYMVCLSICCSGIQVTLSKMVSALWIQNRHESMRKLMRIALLFCLGFSLILSTIIFIFAPQICTYLIKESRCASCLRIAILSLPLVAMKSCLHGYSLGLKKSGVSAISQLLEQIARVLGIYLLSILVFTNSASAILASYGMLIGEFISFLYTINQYLIQQTKISTAHFHSSSKIFRKNKSKIYNKKSKYSDTENFSNQKLNSKKEGNPLSSSILLKSLLRDSIPLTANRLSLTLLQSVEAILMPAMLRLFYKDSSLSLELYGILTGMALPFLFFPATLTNSLSVMLLPTISAAKTKGHQKTISHTTSRTIHLCVCIGIMSSFLFILYGKDLGTIVFSNETAGEVLFLLSLLCPFLYISSSLSSILNGLGYAPTTLWHNLVSVTIRIGFILFFIPFFGIKGYIWGLLSSYIVLLFLDLIKISSLVQIQFSAIKTIFFPCFFSLAAGFVSSSFYQYLILHFEIGNFMGLGIACIIFGGICGMYLIM